MFIDEKGCIRWDLRDGMIFLWWFGDFFFFFSGLGENFFFFRDLVKFFFFFFFFFFQNEPASKQTKPNQTKPNWTPPKPPLTWPLPKTKKRLKCSEKKKSCIQHVQFPGGPPPQYLARSIPFNFRVLMVSGALGMIWPYALFEGQYMFILNFFFFFFC